MENEEEILIEISKDENVINEVLYRFLGDQYGRKIIHKMDNSYTSFEEVIENGMYYVDLDFVIKKGGDKFDKLVDKYVNMILSIENFNKDLIAITKHLKILFQQAFSKNIISIMLNSDSFMKRFKDEYDVLLNKEKAEYEAKIEKINKETNDFVTDVDFQDVLNQGYVPVVIQHWTKSIESEIYDKEYFDDHFIKKIPTNFRDRVILVKKEYYPYLRLVCGHGFSDELVVLHEKYKFEKALKIIEDESFRDSDKLKMIYELKNERPIYRDSYFTSYNGKILEYKLKMEDESEDD